ncbi:MAG: ABC transporter permease [Gemmatimonadota bacterium]
MPRIFNLLPWRRSRLEYDLDRELRYHIDSRVEELKRSGLSEAAARRQTGLEFGSIDDVQEEVRDTWTWHWLDHLSRDFRYAGRTLLRNPGFAAAAVLSLALGIGANAAIFSLVDQVLLRPLPVNEPERLVHLDWKGWSVSSSWGSGNLMSYAHCRELNERGQFFDGVFCRHPTQVNFSTGQQHEPVRAEIVSGSFFPVLGVQPELGRLIGPSDDRQPGAHPVAVLSYGFWQNHFGGARDVIGRKLLINNHPMTVIGIAPASFKGVDPIENPALYLPAMMTQQAVPELGPRVLDRRTVWMHVFARLDPDMTAVQARARIQPWFKSMLDADMRLESFPSVTGEQRAIYLASSLELLPAARGFSIQRAALERPLWVLLGGTSLLLLLAGLNVAGLLLARGAARSREITTRAALGATRSRITSQLLVESALIALGGGLLGLMVAPAVSRALLSFRSQVTDLSFQFDRRFLLFAALVSLVTLAVCGLAPALQAGRRSLISSFNDRSGSTTGGAVRIRKTIVVAQMAFTLILLIGAGLFVQTVARLYAKDRGFDSGRLVILSVNAPAIGYSDSAAVQLMRDLQRKLQDLPGIERAAVSNSSLLSGGSFRRSLTIQSTERIVTEQTIPGLRVSPGFFATLGTRLIAGREFNQSDVPRAEESRYRSVIVNQSFARRYFGTRNPVGQRIGVGNQPDTPTTIEIVGVIEDISFRLIREEEPEHVFFPFGHPSAQSADGSFVLRVRGNPESVFPSIRAAVAEMNPALPVGSLTTLDDQVDRSLGTERMLATLSSGFGAIALLLSVVGLYGVVSFVVMQRRQEIGVRVALGATRSAAVWLITRDALIMIIAGIGIALPAAWALRRLVETQLFGVGAFDGPTIAAAICLLALVALGAALRPAWRAASVSPTEALRFD